VHKRAARYRLHRVYRGVYAVGHPWLTSEGRWMAAVLAYGPEAALSHRSSAAHRGLRPDNRATTDISLPRRSARTRAGVRVHATTTLRPEDVTVHEGIPCTTVARTLLDLAEVISRRGVERAVEQAEVLRVFDGRAVDAVLARAAGRRGAGVLRAVLEELEDPGLTASDLEEDFLALCRNARVTTPEVNPWGALHDEEKKVDFLWRAERLIVETDSRTFHATRRAFERDRRRDQQLLLAGYQVVRFTWRQVTREPNHVGHTIRTLLAQRSDRRTSR
jgi:very-short-patch-repair endonuclease